MITPLETLVAKLAMVRSVGSIMGDLGMSKAERNNMLNANVDQYAEHTGASHAEAASVVTTIAKRLATPAVEAAPAQQPRVEKTTPREPVVEATQGQMVSMVRKAIDDGVAEIRKLRPGIAATSAREIFYAANPGVRKALYGMVNGRPFGEEMAKAAPATGSAEVEFMAKVAAVKAADPRLTDQQAYAQAYTDRSNTPIVKRMKAEQSGGG